MEESEEVVSQGDSVTIVAVGSAMFQTRPSAVQDAGFHELLDLVRHADVGFMNVEAPIREPSAYPVKQYLYTSYVNTEAWLPQELSAAGFNLVSIANNHMSDFSPESIETNRRLLTESGIACSGAGKTLSEARAPAYLDTPRGRFGLISVDSSYEYGQFLQVQMASDPQDDIPGRPGTNGMRWRTYFDLDTDSFERFRRIFRSLGLDREGIETSHISPHPTPDSFLFRGVVVRRGDMSRITTVCHENDLADILRWIRSTRSQVDYLLVSHHNHTAGGDDWSSPVDFVQEFAHHAIDAGADVYIGHGYTPKGIEIYKKRPILYDIGDWSTQDAAARRHPGDAYARWDLDPKATPGEFADARERARLHARQTSENVDFRSVVDGYMRATSQSALVRLIFEHGRLAEVTLYPCIPSAHSARHRRGLPTPATDARGESISRRFAQASEPFGTKVVSTDGVGHVLIG